MRRSLARFAAAALAAALTSAIAGCGGAGDDGPITFQVSGDADEIRVYRQLVAAYERRSDEEVRLVEVGDADAHLARLTTSFAGGRPPDVFLVNYRNFGGFASRKVLDPVGPRLDDSQALRRQDFFPQPLDAFTFGGTLQCLPQNVSSLVVYYNRTMFRRAGLRDPRPDWTYQDFLAAADRLTRNPDGDGEPDVYGVGVDPSVVRAAPFVWSAGGELVDDPKRPTRFALDSPAARRGLDNFLDLYRRGVAPTEIDVEARDFEERFLQGQLAMFLSSRREVPTLRGIESFDWDVAAFPRDRRPATVLHSDAYCLAKGDQSDEAWRFVEFAGGPDGQRILGRGGRTVPSLKAVARSPAFLDPRARPRSSRVFLDAIPTMRPLPNSANWARIEDAASLALKRAYYAELTVEDAIRRIRRETDGVF